MDVDTVSCTAWANDTSLVVENKIPRLTSVEQKWQSV